MSMDGKKKKEVIALSVLGVFAAYMVYSNLLAGPSVPAADRPAAATRTPGDTDNSPLTMPGAVPKKSAAPKSARSTRSRDESFHPIYLAVRPEDRPDPTRIDPTMHLELLARLQDVEPAGSTRNLFVFGTPPPPKPVELPKGAEPTIKPGSPAAAAALAGRGAPPPGPAGPPPEAPLQVNLKYYGIIAYSSGGRKTACFMDGDEILTATEGDTVKRRYRVVRIGNTSVVMEDTESKRQATLEIAKEAQG